jgi:hypothetical protein
MPRTEITELRRTIGQLRQCVSALRFRYGDAPVVRRLVDDVERLDSDAVVFGDVPTAPSSARPSDRSDVVIVPDTPYDRSLWQDADDEGVGGHRRES